MVDKTPYISGQIGFDVATFTEIVQGGIKAEMKQALTDMEAILEAWATTHLLPLE